MNIFLSFLYAFLVGGAICMIGQILILKTKLTAARILVIFVSIGVFLGGVRAFQPIQSVVGAGITVPIIGFGGTLATGVIRAVEEYGFLGILIGGLTATAAGVATAITFGFLVAMVAKSRSKKS